MIVSVVWRSDDFASNCLCDFLILEISWIFFVRVPIAPLTCFLSFVYRDEIWIMPYAPDLCSNDNVTLIGAKKYWKLKTRK